MAALIFESELECMDAGERTALQDKSLRRVLAKVCNNVSFYRERLDAAGMRPDAFHGLDDLPRLPRTTKADLRGHYPFGLLAVRRDELARVHASSGTRGRPTLAPNTRAGIDLWARMCARRIALAGGTPGDVFHVAYGCGVFTGVLGLHADVSLQAPGSLPRSEGEAVRVVDRR